MDTVFVSEVDYPFDVGYDAILPALMATTQVSISQLDTIDAAKALTVLDGDMGNIEDYFAWFNVTDTDTATDQKTTDFYLEVGRFMDLRGHWMLRQKWGWTLFETGSDDLYQSDPRILNSIAVAYQQLEYTEKCVELYRLVIDIGNHQGMETEMLAQAYNNYATALWHAEQNEKAIEQAIQAFRLAAEGDNLTIAMSAMMTEGCARGSLGEFDAASEIFQRVLRIAEKTDDLARMGEVNVQLGLLHFEQGVLEDAKRYLDQVIEIFELIGDEVGVLDTKIVLALYHGIQSEAETSEALTEEAIEGMEQYPPEVFTPLVEWFDQMAAKRQQRDEQTLENDTNPARDQDDDSEPSSP